MNYLHVMHLSIFIMHFVSYSSGLLTRIVCNLVVKSKPVLLAKVLATQSVDKKVAILMKALHSQNTND